MKKINGFTLIELLVVVSIISILTSIALGTFNESRKSARDANRITDMKSISNALELYATSNSGDYPTTDANSYNNWSSLASDLDEGFPDGILPKDPLNTNTYFYTYLAAPAGTVCGELNPKYAFYFIAERTDFGIQSGPIDDSFCITP